jgi:hypothetical protein
MCRRKLSSSEALANILPFLLLNSCFLLQPSYFSWSRCWQERNPTGKGLSEGTHGWVLATGKAVMGALAIFAPARRLLRYALNLMHRKPLEEVVLVRTAWM